MRSTNRCRCLFFFFFVPAAFFCAELKHFRKAAQPRVQTAGLEIPQKDLLHTVSQR